MTGWRRRRFSARPQIYPAGQFTPEECEAFELIEELYARGEMCRPEFAEAAAVRSAALDRAQAGR